MIADIIDSPLLKKHGLLNYKNIHERADKLISDFGVLCQNDDQPIGMLSGGNMQKVVVAREFSLDTLMLVPTSLSGKRSLNSAMPERALS